MFFKLGNKEITKIEKFVYLEIKQDDIGKSFEEFLSIKKPFYVSVFKSGIENSEEQIPYYKYNQVDFKLNFSDEEKLIESFRLLYNSLFKKKKFKKIYLKRSNDNIVID